MTAMSAVHSSHPQRTGRTKVLGYTSAVHQNKKHRLLALSSEFLIQWVKGEPENVHMSQDPRLCCCCLCRPGDCALGPPA